MYSIYIGSGINDWQFDCGTTMLPLFLNPNKTHKMSIHPILVMFLRSLQSIIIPFGISLFMLQDCGRYWTQLWNQCLSDKNSFDKTIVAEVVTHLISTSFSVNVLRHDQVCSVRSIWDVNINKCFRQFLGNGVGNIILPKILILIINPFIILFSHTYQIRTKLKRLLCCCVHQDQDDNEDDFMYDGDCDDDSEEKVSEIEINIQMNRGLYYQIIMFMIKC